MKLSPSPRALVYTVLMLILLAGLVLLGLRAQPIDLSGYERITNALRELRQFNADWDVALLRERAGQPAGGEQTATPQPTVTRLQDELAQASRAYWGAANDQDAGPRLKPLQDKLAQALQSKIDAVEQYQSSNTALQGDVRLLPPAAIQLNRAVVGAGLPADSQNKLWQEINTLLIVATDSIQAPTSDMRERLRQASDNVDLLTRGGSADLAQSGANLVQRAKAVLERLDAINLSLARIGALPVAQAIDDLAGAQASENQRLLAGSGQRPFWLLVYAAVLLLLLALLLVRLAAALRALRHTRAELGRAKREIGESQTHLVQAEKMSFLGQMMTGIAREINVPLADIKSAFAGLKGQLGVFGQLTEASGEFSRLMRAPERDQKQLNQQFRALETAAQTLAEGNVLGDMEQLLERNIHSLEQIAGIVTSLRDFSQSDRDRTTRFSVEQGLDSALLLAHHLLRNKVEVRKEYGHVPDVAGAPAQISQVFLNLIANATYALLAPGQRSQQANLLTLRTSLSEDKKTVRIDIQDNGKGIPANVLPKIFEPFFTTKPAGQSTGQGLSVSQKIVQEHGGRILVESKEGEGATFSILLPIHSPAAQPAAAETDDRWNTTQVVETDERWAATQVVETDAFRKTTLFSDY